MIRFEFANIATFGEKSKKKSFRTLSATTDRIRKDSRDVIDYLSFFDNYFLTIPIKALSLQGKARKHD